MMKKDYKLLLIGRLYNKHQIRFIQNLKMENPEVQIDFFSYQKEKSLPDELKGLINKEYYLYPKIKERSIFFQKVYDIIDIIRLNQFFKQIEDHYDIINVHYPSYLYTFLYNQFRRISDCIVLTPWGSDVYRCKWRNLQILKFLYKKADYITAVSEKFRNDLIKIFRVSISKTIVLDMASDTIDYILENKCFITKQMAKKSFGIENQLVICCGYNGQKAQQHKSIISSIYKAKEYIPKNVVLFLPFMYGGDETYKREIVDLTELYGFNYRLFDTYLDKKEMFLFEQATDLLIHIQTTDASSCSIQEFILLEKKVINGEWLKYPQLVNGTELPYFETKSVDSLADTIKVALSTDIKISKNTLDYIEGCGWKSWIKQWNNFFQTIAPKDKVRAN